MKQDASGYSSPDSNDKSMITTPGDEGIAALLERQITNQLHEVEKILLPILRDDQARTELSSSQKLLLAICMTCTTTITGATNSASNINIPSAAADLEISQLAAQWIASAFSLACGCGLLFAGRLADVFGRKRLYLVGMGVFIVFSIISAVVRNLIGICILRAISGLGASIALPAAFGIVGTTLRREPWRTRTFAAVALGGPVGALPGMLFGALIAQAGQRTWQYQFYIFGGAGLVPVVLGYFVIPSDEQKPIAGEWKRIDFLGGGLITGALALLMFSITQGGLVTKGWREPYIPITFCISILLVVAFGLWQRYLTQHSSLPPVIDLRVFTRHDFKVTYLLVCTTAAYTAIGGWQYISGIWYQTVKGEKPLMSALHIITAPIVGMLACILVPLLAPKIRAPWLLAFGGFTTSAACWLYAVEPEDLTYWAMEFPACICNPFGADFTVGIGSILISNLVTSEEQSMAGGLFQTVLQISITLGICMSSLVQTEVYKSTGDIRRSVQMAYWMLAGLAWLAFILSPILLRSVKLAQDAGDHKETEDELSRQTSAGNQLDEEKI